MAAGSGGVAPLLKWPGGKRRELARIRAALPERPDRLHEPFVGGGAVWLSTPPEVPAVVNDASRDLVDVYRRVAAADAAFLGVLDAVADWWRRIDALADDVAARRLLAGWRAAAEGERHDLVEPVLDALVASVPAGLRTTCADLAGVAATSVPRKLARMVALERRRGVLLCDADARDNVVGALMAAAYTSLRTASNRLVRAGGHGPDRAALFVFLREYAYAAMFRHNAAGDFNVPYGGVSYNRKDLAAKVAHLRSPEVAARLCTTEIRHGDFEDALCDVGSGDAVFLDPPYDTDFSSYDRTAFTWDDQVRLERCARALPGTVVALLRDTPRVRALWSRPPWRMLAWDHVYAWTIKGRNDRAARHVLVANHVPRGPSG